MLDAQQPADMEKDCTERHAGVLVAAEFADAADADVVDRRQATKELERQKLLELA